MKKLLLLAFLFISFSAFAQLDTYEGKLDDNGLRTGEWKTYRVEKLYCIGNYESGKKTGEWKFYHYNGKLSYIGTYEDGKQIGEWRFYYANGKLFAILNFENDVLRRSKYYDKHGKLTSKAKYTLP